VKEAKDGEARVFKSGQELERASDRAFAEGVAKPVTSSNAGVGKAELDKAAREFAVDDRKQKKGGERQ
jgi:hypothetical protein